MAEKELFIEFLFDIVNLYFLWNAHILCMIGFLNYSDIHSALSLFEKNMEFCDMLLHAPLAMLDIFDTSLIEAQVDLKNALDTDRSQQHLVRNFLPPNFVPDICNITIVCTCLFK